MSRVLVVEDEPAVAELIALDLRQAGHTVQLACSADQARQAVEQSLPDIVVLNGLLPGTSVQELARQWRAEQRTRQLALVVHPSTPDASAPWSGDGSFRGHRTSAFSRLQLLARIDAVAHGKEDRSPDQVLDVGPLRLDLLAHRAMAVQDGQHVELSLRPFEFRLLHFFMTFPERVHSRSHLLASVWGREVTIDQRTVDVHVKRLRDALARAGASALIETVRGVGYRLSAGLPIAPSGTRQGEQRQLPA